MNSDAAQVIEGGTYRYTITFKNTADVAFDEVVLRLYYDVDMNIVNVDPKPLTIARATPETPARVEWALGTLKPNRIGAVTLEFQVAPRIDPAKHALNSYSTIEGVSRRGEKIYNASLPHGLAMLGRATPTREVDEKVRLAATVIYKADTAVATQEAAQSIQAIQAKPIPEVQDAPIAQDELGVMQITTQATTDQQHARLDSDPLRATAAAPDKHKLQIVATAVPMPVQTFNQATSNEALAQPASDRSVKIVAPTQTATSAILGTALMASPGFDLAGLLGPIVFGLVAVLAVVLLLFVGLAQRRRALALFSNEIEPVIKGGAGYGNLHRQLCDYFDDDELATLCFQMGIDYRHLRGEGKIAKARELILFMHRRGRIGELASMCRNERPNAQWA